jgi:hypothetical protein
MASLKQIFLEFFWMREVREMEWWNVWWMMRRGNEEGPTWALEGILLLSWRLFVDL